jgi:hypothetical protein
VTRPAAPLPTMLQAGALDARATGGRSVRRVCGVQQLEHTGEHAAALKTEGKDSQAGTGAPSTRDSAL